MQNLSTTLISCCCTFLLFFLLLDFVGIVLLIQTKVKQKKREDQLGGHKESQGGTMENHTRSLPLQQLLFLIHLKEILHFARVITVEGYP